MCVIFSFCQEIVLDHAAELSFSNAVLTLSPNIMFIHVP